MNEYEKYQLQWMLDHNHSIREMITRLGEIAFNEMSNDVGLSFDKIMDEAFEIFEYEQEAPDRETLQEAVQRVKTWDGVIK